MSKLSRLALSGFLIICLLSAQIRQVYAGEVLGVHILHPYEVNDAIGLLKTEQNKDQWAYITIPYTLDDIAKKDEWQGFFDKCREYKLKPIVRMVSRADGPNWTVPTTKDIVRLTAGLSALEWPTDERLVIVFNEPNHAQEWGGKVDPEEYADKLRFTSDWLKTEGKGYKVLPAALDLAASNGGNTMEAFTFWTRAVEHDPELFNTIDDWNSHSYPNPGFSSSPTRTTQNSLRGFEHELTFLKKYTAREFGVYITETGWIDNASTSRYLNQYYSYAQANIWSDPRIKAVTPFILRGAPGPFSGFSLLDQNGNKTRQFNAYRKVIENL